MSAQHCIDSQAAFSAPSSACKSPGMVTAADMSIIVPDCCSWASQSKSAAAAHGKATSKGTCLWKAKPFSVPQST
eukprot:5613175-Lingulodinium_polyedra.AAC.1